MLALLKTIVKWTLRTVFTLAFIAGWVLALLAVHIIIVPEPIEPIEASTGDDVEAAPVESTGDSANEQGVIGDSAEWVSQRFEGWKLVIVPKNRLGFGDTYVDTRGWTAEQAGEHEEVVTRMLEAGKGDLLDHVVEQTVRSRIDDIIENRHSLLAGDE